VRRHLILYLVLIFTLSNAVPAQSWEFVKEKGGIKIYTGKKDGEDLKSYKGIAEINAPADKVFDLIEDVNNTDWWDKNLSQIKVLGYEKYKSARYYLVFDLPWPVADRDLCVDVKITTDKLTGERRITAIPLTGVIPEKEGLVRIKNYRQTWSVTPSGKGVSHVVLEGYVDPAGKIPDWVSNLVIIESPVKAITGVKDRLEGK
jgi:uncharacterized membrane protein